jgi:hypothetical protein
MEIFANKNFTTKEMKDIINRCRMYLQAFYFLDIADISGNYIERCEIKARQEGTARNKWY